MSAKFLVTLDVHVDELHRCPDLLNDMRAEKIDVLYVRGVYSPEMMAAICERLDHNYAGMQRTFQEDANPEVKQHSIYGFSITPSNLHKNGPPLDDYLAAAARFRPDCRRLFEGYPDYETTIVDNFRKLGGGRDITLPATRDGRHYSPSTVRFIPDGCQIPIHVGNYFLHQPVSAPLVELVDTSVQISFFVTVALPGSGGELYVYDLLYEDPRTPRDRIGNVDLAVVERNFRRETHAPGVGDLFIFNGGKYYHRVAHVQAAPHERRWTIGGFLAFAKSDPCIYFWG